MNVLITAAQNPDLDGVACAVAYTEYLQIKHPNNHYTAAFQGVPISEADYVCKALRIQPGALKHGDSFDKFILVDASESTGLPEILRAKDVTEVIDHRMFADYKAFPNANFRVEPVGAAATQIAEYFYFDPSIAITQANAALLLGGIYSNTVNFQSDTVTFRDERMRDWLQTRIADKSKNLPTEMYQYKSQYVLDHLEESLLADAKDNCNQFGLDQPVVVLQIETLLAEELLAKELEVMAIMAKLFPDRVYRLLSIQDAKAGKTYAISDAPQIIKALLAAPLQMSRLSSTRLLRSNIAMRKTILQSVLKS